VNPRRHLAARGPKKDDMRTMQMLTLVGTDVPEQLHIPDYGISKKLPLGKPIATAIVAQGGGHFSLLCPVEDSAGSLLDLP
jgi:hypothetical protein